MPVLINFKICDNAKECNGIAICPVGAISWDAENNKIKLDNSKCINCGQCEPSCGVGAIRFAKTQEDYDRIKKEIEDDIRKISDLFVERYGAACTDSDSFLLKNRDQFKSRFLDTDRLSIAELFSDNSIKCLNSSIPMNELVSGNIVYRKIKMLDNDELIQRYDVKVLPALLFFKGGKLIGKIEGYYSNDQRYELKKKINEII